MWWCVLQELLHIHQEEYLKDREEAEMEMSDSEEGEGTNAPATKKFKQQTEEKSMLILLIRYLDICKWPATWLCSRRKRQYSWQYVTGEGKNREPTTFDTKAPPPQVYIIMWSVKVIAYQCCNSISKLLLDMW